MFVTRVAEYTLSALTRLPRFLTKVVGPIDVVSDPLEDLQDKTAYGDGPMSSMPAHECDLDLTGVPFLTPLMEYLHQGVFDVP